MKNFEFQNPVKIIFGKGEISKLNTVIKQQQKVMIISYKDEKFTTGKIMQQVKSALKSYEIVEFFRVEANPEYELLLEAIKLAKEEHVDFILAVGGGSVLDATKFTSICSANNWDNNWDEVFVNDMKNSVGALPFGCVMTLPATGSEMNNGFVISWRAKGYKNDYFGPFYTYPQFSIIDPETTYTLPAKQTANAIVDSFIHVVEQYVATYTGSDVQDYISTALLRSIYENAQIVLKDPTNYKGRANLCFSATMALNGLLRTRHTADLSVHFMGHQLTALYGIDHGASLVPIQIANFRLMKDVKKDMILHMGRHVFDIIDGTEDQRVEQTLTMVEDFFAQTGVPTKLSHYENIDKSNYIDKVMELLHQHNLVPVGELSISEEKAREILALAY